MTDQQKIEAIAKACGWSDIRPACLKPFTLYGTSKDKEIGRDRLPAFTSDANTRPEMLAVMSNEKKWKLAAKLRLAFARQKESSEFVDWLVGLQQTSFADCWLKAMGLWREEA